MILLPRPEQHLAKTQKALESEGFSAILPLSLSCPQHLSIAVPHNATALIFTSQFGVHPALPRLPAACVGEATAHLAEHLKFPVTIIGTTNAESLARSIIAAHRTPQHFLHPHGEKAPLSWHKLLHDAGHTITPLLAYTTGFVASISVLHRQLLQKNPPTHTLLFSANSAEHLAKLLKQANIAPNGTAICLSEAVAKAAKPHWPRVLVATTPSQEALIACLKKDTSA